MYISQSLNSIRGVYRGIYKYYRGDYGAYREFNLQLMGSPTVNPTPSTLKWLPFSRVVKFLVLLNTGGFEEGPKSRTQQCRPYLPKP